MQKACRRHTKRAKDMQQAYKISIFRFFVVCNTVCFIFVYCIFAVSISFAENPLTFTTLIVASVTLQDGNKDEPVIVVELATNERRNLKPRGAKNWRGASALMRGLGTL